jgi:hypothetical protein
MLSLSPCTGRGLGEGLTTVSKALYVGFAPHPARHLRCLATFSPYNGEKESRANSLSYNRIR